MTLTKAELADLLFEQLGLNKREAKDMVERFFEEIRIALESGDSVKLSGFGNFQLREKPLPDGGIVPVPVSVEKGRRRMDMQVALDPVRAARHAADPLAP